MGSRHMEQFDCDSRGCESQTIIDTENSWNSLPLGWGQLNYYTGNPESSNGKMQQGRAVLCPMHWEDQREQLEGLNWKHD